MPTDPKQELLVAIAGPAVNVAIAAVLAAVLWGMGDFPRSVWPGTLLEGSFLGNLMRVNLFLVAFNALPAFPMDGGRVLRALLAQRMDYVKATDIAATVGQMMAILFGVAGLLVFANPLLLLIAFFVYMGAEAEAQLVRTRVALEDVPVRAAMMTRFRTLAPLDTLRTAADELLAGAQQDFPIVQDGGFTGLLLRRDLVRGLQEAGPDSPVSQFTTAVPRVLAPSELLEDALQTMRSANCTSLPVAENGELLGIVTLENVGELIMVQTAVRGADTGARDPRDLMRAA
jgi:CBS domain-containing protein